MKNETFGIVAGLGGLLLGILAAPLFFGMGNWGHMGGRGYMVDNDREGRNGRGGSYMMGNIDGHFIEQMIPHHEDAILMADIALTKAEHPEIKQLSRNIKTSQSAEIVQMSDWYKLWYGVKVPESSSGMGGEMVMGGGGMMGDMTEAETLKDAKPFDKEFIEQMIPHHQMAVMMATMLLRGTDREEMKTLARNIINAQSSEIEQMKFWYRDWYGK